MNFFMALVFDPTFNSYRFKEDSNKCENNNSNPLLNIDLTLSFVLSIEPIEKLSSEMDLFTLLTEIIVCLFYLNFIFLYYWREFLFKLNASFIL